MDKNSYSFECLKRTGAFPQSVYHRAKYDEVFKAITGLPAGSYILDAGCGIGQKTGKFADRYRVFGLGEQPQAVDYCLKHWPGNYVAGSLYNAPFKDNYFDFVLFLDAIEHLDNPVKALRELKRVLKPGGTILVCATNYASPLWFILEHTWHRFAGRTGTYAKEVHPTQYTPEVMRDHCTPLFEEISLHTRIMRMEIFFIGSKNDRKEDTACPHTVSREIAKFDNIVLSRCVSCHMVFSDSCGTNINTAELYENYYSSNEIVGRFNSPTEYLIKLFRFFRAFKMFTIHPRARSLLDIGSGRGLMLYYLMKHYKYDRAVGIQISKEAYEYSKNVLGLEMYDKDMLELNFENESFDIVTLWHVLEHVKEPELYVKKIQNLLKKNGKLVIEVPNFNSWTRKITGRYWLGLDLKYHLYFFTKDSLSRLLKKNGFNIKTVHTFSLEYSTFISVQSIISRLTRSDQLFFYYLQGKSEEFSKPLHIMMFMLLTPICFLVNLILYYSTFGEVLLFIADKPASSLADTKEGICSQ